MYLVLHGTGVVVAVLAGVAVYRDAAGLGLDRAGSLGAVVGVLSLLGFVVPWTLLQVAYSGLPDRDPVVPVPDGGFAWLFVAGLATSVAAVSLYGIASRMGREVDPGAVTGGRRG